LGTGDGSFAMKSSGLNITWVVPSLEEVLSGQGMLPVDVSDTLFPIRQAVIVNSTTFSAYRIPEPEGLTRHAN